MPLVITGIAVGDAHKYLEGIELDDVVFAGPVARATHRHLVRRASVYVSASRREEYGTAQLEALADGVPLVTVPSRGAGEPLALARQLRPDLVARDISAASLVPCIRAALAMTPARRSRYRIASQEIMKEYSYDAFKRRLVQHVLPPLLD
jgi:glycosyltransferase involved in cell wall biosynthesis